MYGKCNQFPRPIHGIEVLEDTDPGGLNNSGPPTTDTFVGVLNVTSIMIPAGTPSNSNLL